jgi:hypothetical protein
LETNLENLENVKVQKTLSIRHLIAKRAKNFKKKYDIDISEVFEKGAVLYMDQYEKEHK